MGKRRSRYFNFILFLFDEHTTALKCSIQNHGKQIFLVVLFLSRRIFRCRFNHFNFHLTLDLTDLTGIITFFSISSSSYFWLRWNKLNQKRELCELHIWRAKMQEKMDVWKMFGCKHLDFLLESDVRSAVYR